MHFASPIPLWAATLVAVCLLAVALLAYRRPLVPLTRAQRTTLIALRAAALLALLFFFCRPIVLAPPDAATDVAVPVLVDASRSMSIDDDGRGARITRAAATIAHDVLPAIGTRFKPDLYAFGDGLTPVETLDAIHADGPRSDIAGAIAAVRDRYRGRPVAGVVLVSDGGDTGGGDLSHADIPVFAIGIGSADGPKDREVTGITAGDPRLDAATVDVHVTATTRGFGRAPFDLRLSANGRLVESRRIVPASDRSPLEETFTVAPDSGAPTVVSAEIPPEAGEAVIENNARTVLISPRGRKRRVLVLEGAPGFEHSFLTRALGADPNFEIDVVTRKGKNDAGQDTFFVQASAGRATSLTSGFPARREDLFGYDAVIVANVSGDFLSRAQMTLLADFVSTRGGGLLVLGGASFAGRGFSGTPLEPVIPVELGDRRGGVVRTSLGAGPGGPPDVVVPTAEGESHPVTRLGATREETRKKWAALPPLAGAAALGGPRPGATILAVTTEAGGASYPVVAVQQYGEGRSMVFGGEASWRWRMLLPETDHTYESFWREAVRWLAAPSPDPVWMSAPGQPQPGEATTIAADVRDAAFAPVSGASVTGSVALQDGQEHPLTFRRDAATGRFIASFVPQQKGAYHAQLRAANGATPLGSAERWFYVGGSDRETADPRLNEGTMRRIAWASGGEYVAAGGAGAVREWLDARSAEGADLEPRDLWQKPWMIALAVLLLSAEWILRRRWGLR